MIMKIYLKDINYLIDLICKWNIYSAIKNKKTCHSFLWCIFILFKKKNKMMCFKILILIFSSKMFPF